MGINLLHVGVRRNNAEYIRAGHMAFAPLFHRNDVSKYALIDLHDRLVMTATFYCYSGFLAS